MGCKFLSERTPASKGAGVHQILLATGWSLEEVSAVSSKDSLDLSGGTSKWWRARGSTFPRQLEGIL